MRVEETIRIAQPPEKVWAVVADPGNDPRWCRTVKSVDPVGDSRWRVMHKPTPLRPPRELELKQLAAEPPCRLVLGQEDAAAVFNVEYRLEPTQTGTRFTQVSEFTWKTLPHVLHALAPPEGAGAGEAQVGLPLRVRAITDGAMAGHDLR